MIQMIYTNSNIDDATDVYTDGDTNDNKDDVCLSSCCFLI